MLQHDVMFRYLKAAMAAMTARDFSAQEDRIVEGGCAGIGKR